MVKYFFIPGKNKDLAFAELKSLREILNNSFVIRRDVEFFEVGCDDIDTVRELFARTGAFVKYGVFLPDDVQIAKVPAYRSDILSEKRNRPAKSTKRRFGLSAYTSSLDFSELKKLAYSIKRDLTRAGLKYAYILPKKGNALNTAQVLYNDLLDSGFELDVFDVNETQTGISTRFGITLGVQDMSGYVKRDTEKPLIDLEMGVLPHKLARTMVNLLGLPIGNTVWDPFAGSGVLGMEALLLGYNVLLSDKSPESVVALRANLAWLAEEYDLGSTRQNVFQFDMHEKRGKIYSRLTKSDIGGVVFEPYMGPPQKNIIPVKKAKKLVNEVTSLLRDTFKTIEKIQHRPLKVVAVVPSYKSQHGWLTPTTRDFVRKKLWRTPSALRGMQLYSQRPRSIIRRNILVLERV